MSPEQADGEDLDARSDQFSLGILLWEMTTGERLFSRATDFVTLRAVSSGDVRPPSEFVSDYPVELEKIVMRALSKDAADRYPTCADLAADIEEFLTTARVPHSAARLGRYMTELFSDAFRAEQALPIMTGAVDLEIKSPVEPPQEQLPVTIASVVPMQPNTLVEEPTVTQASADTPSFVEIEDAEQGAADDLAVDEDIPDAPAAAASPDSDTTSLMMAIGSILASVDTNEAIAAAAPTNIQAPPAASDEPPSFDVATDSFMSVLGSYLLTAQSKPRRRTNIIEDIDAFVGRADDLQALHALFARGERLVTLMGARRCRQDASRKTLRARSFGPGRRRDAAWGRMDGGSHRRPDRPGHLPGHGPRP